jgi:hypothetical protein
MTMSAIRFSVFYAIVLVLSAPSASQAGPFMEWLCGCSSNLRSQSTYVPAYVPTAEFPAPGAATTTYYAPTAIAPVSTTTYYAPPVVYPAPVTVYRPLPVVPRPTTTLQVTSGYAPYSATPVTVYRPIVPVQPVITTTRLIPYTTYRMVYPSTVTYYGATPAYYVPYSAPVAVPVPAPIAEPVYEQAPLQSYPAQAVPESSSSDPASVAPSLSGETTTNYPMLQPPPVTTEKVIIDDSATDAIKVETKKTPTPAPKADSKSSETELNGPKNGSPTTLRVTPEENSSLDRTTMRPVRQISQRQAAPTRQPAVIHGDDVWQTVKD